MASISRYYLPFRGGQLLHCNQSISLPPQKKTTLQRAVPPATALGEPVSHIGIGCGAKVKRWIFKILWCNQLERKTLPCFFPNICWKNAQKKTQLLNGFLDFFWRWNCWMRVCASSGVGFPPILRNTNTSTQSKLT